MTTEHKCDLCPKSKTIPQDEYIHQFNDYGVYKSLNYGLLRKKPVVFSGEDKDFLKKNKVSEVTPLHNLYLCRKHAEELDKIILGDEVKDNWGPIKVEASDEPSKMATVRRRQK